MFEVRDLRRQSVVTRLMRVLVAGGTGFLGRSIVRALVARAADVAILSRDPERSREKLRSLPSDIRAGDVTRPASLRDPLADVDALVICVQFPGFPVEASSRGRTFMEVDAGGTEALVAAAGESGLRKVVYLSGVGADADSRRPWYRAKGIAEGAIRDSGLVWSIVRPSWVYGPDDVSLNRFAQLIRTVPFCFPQLGSGQRRVSPLHVADLADLVADVTLGAAADSETLEAGGPEDLSLDEILTMTMRVMRRRKPICHVPIGLAKLGATVLELLPGQILSRDAVDFITQEGVVDRVATSRCFPDFAPRDLERGLSEYLAPGSR